MSVRRLMVLVTAAGLAVGLAVAAVPSPSSAAGPSDLYVEMPANGGSDTNSCAQLDPCASVARALSAADPGGSIHVGVGTFDGEIDIDKSVAIDGVSPDQTVLTTPQDSGSGFVVGVTAGTTNLSDLTIHGGLFVDLLVDGTGTAVGDHVVLAAGGCALLVESGSASLADSTVQGGGQPGCSSPNPTSGQIVVKGGSVALTRTRVLGPEVGEPAVRVLAGTFSADQSLFDDSAHDVDTNASDGVEVKGGTAAISRSTFHGFGGAGVFTSGGTAVLTDDTFQGNVVGVSGWSGSATVVRSTFEGELAALLYTVSVAGSVFGPDSVNNCTGTITDLGYNLATDHSCGLSASTSHEDVTALHLDSGLSDRGGPVPTVATLSPSAAVDTIPVGATYGDLATPLCPAGGTTDLRGVPRPQVGACDAGSMELIATATLLHAPATADPYAEVTLGATVDRMDAGTELPIGAVTFRSGAEVLCVGTVVGRDARCTTSALGVGRHSLTAVFTASEGSTLHSSVSTSSTILVGTKPAFTTRDKVRFVVGKSRDFRVQASGIGAPRITLIKGHLPAGLRLRPGIGRAILRGTARRAAIGTYLVTLQAANPQGTDEQVLRIVVARP